MANKRKASAISRAIEKYISGDSGRSMFKRFYSNWYIGVTNNPKLRLNQHRTTKKVKGLYFESWDAGDVETALLIEKFFHNKGMLDSSHSGGIRRNSRYVYVFKNYPNLIEEFGLALSILK